MIARHVVGGVKAGVMVDEGVRATIVRASVVVVRGRSEKGHRGIADRTSRGGMRSLDVASVPGETHARLARRSPCRS